MSDITIAPRIAGAGRIRCWVAATHQKSQPAISWTIDQEPAKPHVIKSMQSTYPPDPTGCFTGIFEFVGLDDGRVYSVSATLAKGDTAALRTVSGVKHVMNDRFNILLLSCYDYQTDVARNLDTKVSQLPGVNKPNLTLLLGDQVYLDVPVRFAFLDDESWLAKEFERQYMNNFGDSSTYGKALRLAPSLSIPDDHEYWNNYPHAQVHIHNTYTAASRARWTRAAELMYQAFQSSSQEDFRDPVFIDIDPFTFACINTRSTRLERNIMDRRQWEMLMDWTERAIANPYRMAVIATGQSLLRRKANVVNAQIRDSELPNYSDFWIFQKMLEKFEEAGRKFLLLTGDVHFGRITTMRSRKTGVICGAEIISSPVSLVQGVVPPKENQPIVPVEWWRAWPRHPEPSDCEGPLTRQFICDVDWRQKGNHFAVVSLYPYRNQVDVIYQPLHHDEVHNKMIKRTLFY
jgi:hypothetical protein